MGESPTRNGGMQRPALNVVEGVADGVGGGGAAGGDDVLRPRKPKRMETSLARVADGSGGDGVDAALLEVGRCSRGGTAPR